MINVCYQELYPDFNEYIDNKIIRARLDNDKRVYKENGEVEFFSDPEETYSEW